MIRVCATADADDIVAFMESWTAQDVYDRFGTLGTAGPLWLLSQLREGRMAYIARHDGAVLGILDFGLHDGTANFGIIVHARFRRRGIGSRLVASLLTGATRRITGETSFANHAAVAFLRHHGFRRIWSAGGEAGWEWTPS